jgi:hypothetical protein
MSAETRTGLTEHRRCGCNGRTENFEVQRRYSWRTPLAVQRILLDEKSNV